MRRSRRKVTDLQPSSASPEEDYLHFRLCHICLHLNESHTEILKCERCGTYLTVQPFMDKLPREIREHWEGKREREWGSSEVEPRRGLHGLMVLW